MLIKSIEMLNLIKNLLFIISLKEFLFSFFQVLITFGEFVLAITGIYTFYRTFISKKIKVVGLGHASSTWEGYSYSITLQNFSLSAISINSIDFILNNEESFCIIKNSSPIVLEPLRAIKFESQKLSEQPFDYSLTYSKKFKICIHCSNGKKIIVKRKKPIIKKKFKYKTLTAYRATYNDMLITDSMKYKVSIFIDGKLWKETVMGKTGNLKDDINGYNAISSELIDDEDALKRALMDLVNKKNCTIVLEDISL